MLVTEKFEEEEGIANFMKSQASQKLSDSSFALLLLTIGQKELLVNNNLSSLSSSSSSSSSSSAANWIFLDGLANIYKSPCSLSVVQKETLLVCLNKHKYPVLTMFKSTLFEFVSLLVNKQIDDDERLYTQLLLIVEVNSNSHTRSPLAALMFIYSFSYFIYPTRYNVGMHRSNELTRSCFKILVLFYSGVTSTTARRRRRRRGRRSRLRCPSPSSTTRIRLHVKLYILRAEER